MRAIGIELIGEDVTNKGRIDLTLKLPNAIYVIEFKTDGANALAQIKERKYHEKYLGDETALL
ncbi:MAG: PD-(D/E)XK nuclease domain-containing protein [Sulfurovum sp.]|nr:PD-(D/E)XK nuclease domain-containing protein [Sulfurovum sp.]